MADYIKPESRFRMPSFFDFVGRKMGETLLSDESVPTEIGYDLFSKYNDNPMVKTGETQLTQSLFKMPQDTTKIDDRVFDLSSENNRDIFTISSSKHGKEYQGRLDRVFKKDIDMHAKAYSSLDDAQAAEDFLTESKKKFIFKNPDTGEMSYKFREGILGDVYLNPKGEFSDYWNIGLDKGEEITNVSNLKRKLAAPFTTPPTVKGSINLDESTKSFYNLLFSDSSVPIETKLINDMKDKPIFKGD